MEIQDNPSLEEISFRDAAPGLWQWLALRRIAERPSYGYELIRYFERFGWGGGPAASAVYPYLGRFLAEGLLSVKQRGRRKMYEITSKGEEHLRATAHPYFERIFQVEPPKAQEPDFSEATAQVAAVVDVLKERGTAKELKRAASILFKAAGALRRLTEESGLDPVDNGRELLTP